MSGRILLLLGISNDSDKLIIEKTPHGRDVTVSGRSRESESRAAEKALQFAELNSKKVVAFQVLHSDLYNHVHSDIILPKTARQKFIAYVRDEVLRRGKENAEKIKKEARMLGVTLEVRSAESADASSAAIEEVRKGYDMVFLPKERERFFPIFEKTIEQQLRKKGYKNVISC